MHPCTVINAQVVMQILDLQVVGRGETNGYIQAAVLLSDGCPVCGTVDTLTAAYACNSKNLFYGSAQGTVSSIK